MTYCPQNVMARLDPTRVTHLIFLRYINGLRTISRFGFVLVSPAFVLAASWKRLGISWGSGVPFHGRMRCVHLVGLVRAIVLSLVMMPVAGGGGAMTD